MKTLTQKSTVSFSSEAFSEKFYKNLKDIKVVKTSSPIATLGNGFKVWSHGIAKLCIKLDVEENSRGETIASITYYRKYKVWWLLIWVPVIIVMALSIIGMIVIWKAEHDATKIIDEFMKFCTISYFS